MGKRSREDEDDAQPGPSGKRNRGTPSLQFNLKKRKKITNNKWVKRKRRRLDPTPEPENLRPPLLDEETIAQVIEQLYRPEMYEFRRVFVDNDMSLMTAKRWLQWLRWKKISVNTEDGYTAALHAADAFVDNELVKLNEYVKNYTGNIN